MLVTKSEQGGKMTPSFCASPCFVSQRSCKANKAKNNGRREVSLTSRMCVGSPRASHGGAARPTFPAHSSDRPSSPQSRVDPAELKQELNHREPDCWMGSDGVGGRIPDRRRSARWRHAWKLGWGSSCCQIPGAALF